MSEGEEFRYPNQGNLLFHAKIPGRVVVKKNGTQRKYSFKRRRTITCASDKYMEWESRAHWILRQKRLGMPSISCNIMLLCFFNFSSRRSLPDLSNCYGGPEDALQKAGVVVNDRQVKSHDGSRIRLCDEDSVEIFVFEYIGD